MRARLTATTVLIGLPAAYLLVPARGMAGDVLGDGVDGAIAVAGATDAPVTVMDAAAMATVGAATTAVVVTQADADMRVVRWVDTAVGLAAIVGALGIVPADSMAAEAAGSTVVAVVRMVVADTGKLRI
jgi:hypothetical protein